MANQELIDILTSGVTNWNEWREQNLEAVLDLSGADLLGLNFSGANLSGANLSRMNLIGAYLIGADLSGADLSRTNLISADLSGADLSGARFSGADLSDAELSGANLSGANLIRAKLSRTGLFDAYLINADLSRARLIGADLSRAKLNRAKFLDAYLNGADLSHANLSHANLSRARLIGANLSSAKLELTDFSKAYFESTVMANIDLATAKGLDSIEHWGPSSIGIDTLYKSGGNIPEEFLRGCGVPDDFITYSRSLTGRAFDFYSCFISYSSKNQTFADRLYSDLQTKGVRCWFASEDLKIGEKFRQRIDESIRLHDKLLLVLSRKAIASPWVENEVEAALEQERRENRLVLFPVTLDDAIWDTDKAWAASLRRERQIGDFKEWKSHDSYQKAFERLLRDLKASEPDK